MVHGSRFTAYGMRASLRVALALLLVLPAAAWAQPAVEYRVSFADAVHRVLAVDATFAELPSGPVALRMSRSSPGRYALHEFAKNVFDVRVTDGAGRPLAVTRPNPHEWDVAGHDGTVQVHYRVFGDRIDGTYLAVDETHAHLNMPAALMWARGLDARPARVTFALPAGSSWRVATQLQPTVDPRTFTAPNLQYLMDSPTEVSAHALRTFTVDERGRPATFRVALHHDGSEADLDAFARDVEKVVREERAVIGELPAYDFGTYTFLIDYLPWADGDGMEHRNSTVITSRGSIRTADDRQERLGTVAHEFFHCWNVERIRPQGLEPFDFEEANMSGLLWLAEGFTSYYQTLVLQRAGIDRMDDTLQDFARLVNAMRLSPGLQIRSVEEMSRLAPFVDAARSVDRTNWENSFLSYYTAGAGVGLALDLALRDHTSGRATLDDFMRAMWRAYGAPGGSRVGYVDRPYSIADAQARLAEVSDAAFAADFFRRYVQGHEIADYARLLGRAGFAVHPARPGAAWLGDLRLDQGRVTAPVVSNWPAYEAGLMQDDELLGVAGKPVRNREDLISALSSRKPGDRVELEYLRRDSRRLTETVTLREDPTITIVPVESSGGTLSPAQKGFRDGWLLPRAPHN